MTDPVRLSPSGKTLDTSAELAELQAELDVVNSELVEIWEILEGQGPGAVLSVFGRSGAVQAQANDYDTDQIANGSAVAGSTATQALDALLGALAGLVTGVSSVYGRAGAVVATSGDYNSTLVTNSSGVAGATVTAALNTLSAALGALVTGVSSVYGRAGAVVATSGDYNSTLVTNSSGVAGATVTAALNTLNSALGALVTGVSSVYGRAGAVVATAGDYTSTLVTNSSGVAGATVTAALNTLNSALGALVTGVSSVYGRAGAVVAAAGDYDAIQVDNDSDAPGANVKESLSYVNASALFHWGAVASSATTAARFFLRTFASASATEAQGQISAGRACTIRGIRVTCAVASPTDSITFTLRVNGVSSAVTVTLPATQTTAVATGFSVAVAAGDRLSMQFAQSGTDTVSTWNCDVVVF